MKTSASFDVLIFGLLWFEWPKVCVFSAAHCIDTVLNYDPDSKLFHFSRREQNTFSPHNSYLPIIVECCWTAASKRRSNMVHSPIFVHAEITRKLCRQKRRILLFPLHMCGERQQYPVNRWMHVVVCASPAVQLRGKPERSCTFRSSDADW